MERIIRRTILSRRGGVALIAVVAAAAVGVASVLGEVDVVVFVLSVLGVSLAASLWRR